MRKNIKTYEDRRRTIRSFYLAPIVGLILVFCIPFVYFLYLVIGKQPGMFRKENVPWILPSVFGFLIELGALLAMGIQAHLIRKKMMDDMQDHIIRGLQRIGS